MKRGKCYVDIQDRTPVNINLKSTSLIKARFLQMSFLSIRNVCESESVQNSYTL